MVSLLLFVLAAPPAAVSVSVVLSTVSEYPCCVIGSVTVAPSVDVTVTFALLSAPVSFLPTDTPSVESAVPDKVKLIQLALGAAFATVDAGASPLTVTVFAMA
jgi:hypothetical protein